ncbi:MAG: acetyl-CoA carboxylase, biotin carboxyl carrier protein [Ruminiclostridium sp.]|nr:acetyl-CoA carboxylase, biotin carboxyl carrier protein [Ruminiclostridium sp.]
MQYDKLSEAVKEMVSIMKENQLGRLHVKSGEFEIELGESFPMAEKWAGHTVMTHPVEIPTPQEQESKPQGGRYIKSPIVGTFYAASAPGKPPFVKAGKSISKGDVVFIIESMKLMNEVKSELDGVVAEVLVSDGEAVEYDQPILRLE